jgi:hypothetical protein
LRRFRRGLEHQVWTPWLFRRLASTKIRAASDIVTTAARRYSSASKCPFDPDDGALFAVETVELAEVALVLVVPVLLVVLAEPVAVAVVEAELVEDAAVEVLELVVDVTDTVLVVGSTRRTPVPMMTPPEVAVQSTVEPSATPVKTIESPVELRFMPPRTTVQTAPGGSSVSTKVTVVVSGAKFAASLTGPFMVTDPVASVPL